MKRLSLKIKLTLLYTFFMVLATCAVLAILFSLSNREILAGAQSRLERRVQDSADDITLEDGELRLLADVAALPVAAARPVSLGRHTAISNDNSASPMNAA